MMSDRFRGPHFGSIFGAPSGEARWAAPGGVAGRDESSTRRGATRSRSCWRGGRRVGRDVVWAGRMRGAGAALGLSPRTGVAPADGGGSRGAAAGRAGGRRRLVVRGENARGLGDLGGAYASRIGERLPGRGLDRRGFDGGGGAPWARARGRAGSRIGQSDRRSECRRYGSETRTTIPRGQQQRGAHPAARRQPAGVSSSPVPANLVLKRGHPARSAWPRPRGSRAVVEHRRRAHAAGDPR